MYVPGLAGHQRDGGANSYAESGPLYKGTYQDEVGYIKFPDIIRSCILTTHQVVIQLNSTACLMKQLYFAAELLPLPRQLYRRMAAFVIRPQIQLCDRSWIQRSTRARLLHPGMPAVELPTLLRRHATRPGAKGPV
jgi:hypothetical protein